MTIVQIEHLLENANNCYLKRELDQVILLTQSLLDGVDQTSHPEYWWKTQLLRGKAYATLGRYQDNISHYYTAKEHLNQLRQSEFQTDHSELYQNLLAGEIHYGLIEFEQAEKHFNLVFKQGKKIDSLEGQVMAQCALSRLYIKQNDFEKAQELAKAALEIIESQENGIEGNLLVEAYHQMAQVYIKRQEFSKVPDLSKSILKRSRRAFDVEKELVALNNLAVVNGVLSDYKTAMQYFLEALKIGERINYRRQIVRCHINIGTIYAHLFNHDEALARYTTVLSDYSDIIEDGTKVIINNNIGNIYYTTNQPSLAKTFFTKALEQAKECNYKEMVAHAMTQLSRTETALGNFEEALSQAEEAQRLLQKMGDVNGRQINLINLGNIYYQKGAYKEAIEFVVAGIAASKKTNDDASEIRGHQLLANIYKEQKNFEKALEYQIIYSNSQEKFSREQRDRRVLDMEINYSIKAKQKEIEQLTKENEYQSILLSQSDQIKDQNEQLLEAVEELKQFAYVASHDLKEPLRMIGSYTQLIFRFYKDKLDDDAGQYFGFINEGVVRMNNLLDALLQYATIGKSEQQVDDVDLNMVLEICKVNLKVLLEETQANIEWDNLPTIYTNNTLVIQLFQNLISNAIKFRRPNVIPEVRVKSELQKEDFLISVSDNGIGIDPEHQERIFVIFQRLNARQDYEGTGIGLAICMKIIKRLGGKIWVESTVGEGATFFFTIPKSYALPPDPLHD